MNDTGIIVAIPFYKNPNLVHPLTDSLMRCAADLRSLQAKLLFIVDSPDDQTLIRLLEERAAAFAPVCEAQILINEANLGFVKSANRALEQATTEKRDIILLNSDVEVFEGALVEMRDIAYSDHMIAFVSPRSNNATICTIPKESRFQRLDAEASHQVFRRIQPHLKKVSYAPTAVGFALYIKWPILKDFGYFDPIYGLGYNEENDLVMRANRAGYRAAIANHAFIYHAGEESFGRLEIARHERNLANASVLNNRYPEYERAVETYLGSTGYLAETLLDGVLPGPDKKKTRIGFDLTSIGPFHNGTFEAAKKIVTATVDAGDSDYQFFAICTREAFEFHELGRIEGLVRLDEAASEPVAALIRIGQPWSFAGLAWARRRAPVLAIMMLDTIALDCAYISTPQLHALWQSALNAADVVTFNSRYSMEQFRSRFSFSDRTEYFSLLHSVNVEEYRPASNFRSSGLVPDIDDYVLVVGNTYSHKFLAETVDEIRKRNSSRHVVVFGAPGVDADNIRYIPSGEISDEDLRNLYQNSARILFPSHYEGFGFPILHALAIGKPIFARDMPVFREIAKTCEERANIHLFTTTEEMVGAAFSDIAWQPRQRQAGQDWSWSDTAAGILNAVTKRLQTVRQEQLEQKLAMVRGGALDAGAPAISASLLQAVLRFVHENADLRDALRSGLGDEQSERRLVAGSPVFDADFYVATYGDVAQAGVDPIEHYLSAGWIERRNPSPFFDTDRYLQQYPDVLAAGVNPLIHFLCYGVYEGREIRSPVNVEIGSEG